MMPENRFDKVYVYAFDNDLNWDFAWWKKLMAKRFPF
jgi:hypothetical protein